MYVFTAWTTEGNSLFFPLFFPSVNDQISQEVFQLKFSTHFSSFPCVLYSPPDSSSCRFNIPAQRTHCETPHYTIFCNIPSLLRCRATRFSRSVYVNAWTERQISHP